MTDINKIKSADELVYKEEELAAAEAALDAAGDPETGERTIETVTAEIIMLKRGAEQIALHIAIELGRRLTEAKEMLPHGEWGPWLEERVSFSQDTAGRYMRLFREYADGQTSLFGAEVNSATLRNLSVSKALALLAVPAEEREEFAAEHQVDKLSTRQMDELMKQLKDAEDAKEIAEAALAGERLEKEIAEAALAGERLEKEQIAAARDDLARRVVDLESRPVEVAVQEPDPKELQARVDAAVAEATKEAKKTVSELKKQLKAASDRAETLEKEAADHEKAAGEATAAKEETDRLREQLQIAEKKLAMSDAAVSAVNVHFETVQMEFGKLVNGLLRIADEATREKVRGAVLQLLDNFRAEVAV